MIISRRELQARWSFAELTGRFASIYDSNHDHAEDRRLIARVRQGTAFDALGEADRNRLADWFETGYRSDFFNALCNWYVSFRCESWTRERLLDLGCLSVLDPAGQDRIVPLRQYLQTPRPAASPADEVVYDARIMADQMPLLRFEQREPLIAGHWDDGAEVLWEGYFRAALFCRMTDPAMTILIWVPHEGDWPGKQAGG